MSLLSWRRIGSGSSPLEVNKLAISGLGSEYQFFINGVKVADINDPRASGGGVGFLVISEPNEDSVVEFDDFRLYVPQNRSKVTWVHL